MVDFLPSDQYVFPVGAGGQPGVVPQVYFSMFYRERYREASRSFNDDLNGSNPSIDIAVTLGSMVVAPISGTVVYSGPVKEQYPGTEPGYTVTIHGIDGNYYRLMHLQEEGLPALNAQVNTGDEIGHTAYLGENMGAHLDFRVFVEGTPPEGADAVRGRIYTGASGTDFISGYYVDPFTPWGTTSEDQRSLMWQRYNPNPNRALTDLQAEIGDLDISAANSALRDVAAGSLRAAGLETEEAINYIPQLDLRNPGTFADLAMVLEDQGATLASAFPRSNPMVQQLAALLQTVPAVNNVTDLEEYVESSRQYLQDNLRVSAVPEDQIQRLGGILMRYSGEASAMKEENISFENPQAISRFI
ncbi:peptidoglycan DD-metalloendopeptidase family protein [bacterium]|nr:peptidoglycan DD-metalloendopeptidase family protein [bacterium]